LLNNEAFDCSDELFMPRGNCQFAARKRFELLDTYVEWSDYKVTQFRTFSFWLLSTLSFAQFHHATCLSPIAGSCNDKATDPVFNQTMYEISDAIQEVSLNIARIDYCIEKSFLRLLDGERIKKNTDINKCASENQEGDREGKINLCLSQQITGNLLNESTLNQFYWRVITISFINNDDNRETNFLQNKQYDVAYDANNRSNDPTIHGSKMILGVKFDGDFKTRSFYFQYVRKDYIYKPMWTRLEELGFATYNFALMKEIGYVAADQLLSCYPRYIDIPVSPIRTDPYHYCSYDPPTGVDFYGTMATEGVGYLVILKWKGIRAGEVRIEGSEGFPFGRTSQGTKEETKFGCLVPHPADVCDVLYY
jgi:hypothetical protein